MSNIREISKKYLSGETKYSFCPFCVQELEHEGKNYKEMLKPLVLIKTVEQIKNKDGTYSEYYDQHYECSRCQNRKITTETFRLFYTCRSDGTKWNELPKEPGTVWDNELKKLVPARWNSVKRVWEKI